MPRVSLFSANTNKCVKLWSSCSFKGGLGSGNAVGSGSCCSVFAVMALEDGPSQLLSQLVPSPYKLASSMHRVILFAVPLTFSSVCVTSFWVFATAQGKLWSVKRLKSLLGEWAPAAPVSLCAQHCCAATESPPGNSARASGVHSAQCSVFPEKEWF